jgi:hypothetical protein
MAGAKLIIEFDISIADVVLRDLPDVWVSRAQRVLVQNDAGTATTALKDRTGEYRTFSLPEVNGVIADWQQRDAR